MAHKAKDDVPSLCRSALEEQQIKESKNLKFKPGTALICAPDLTRLKTAGKCPKATIAPGTSLGGENLQCLVDNEGDVKSAACKSKIREQNKATSEDIRARPGGAGACQGDIEILCSDITPGGGRRNRCLQDNMNNLTPECRRIQENIMEREAKDVTLSPMLQNKCFNEQKAFCAEEKDQARDQIMTCLKANQEKEGFSTTCKAEVARFKIDPKVLSILTKSRKAGTKALATEVLKSEEFKEIR